MSNWHEDEDEDIDAAHRSLAIAAGFVVGLLVAVGAGAAVILGWLLR